MQQNSHNLPIECNKKLGAPAGVACVEFGGISVQCLSRADLVNLALSDCRVPLGRPRLVFDLNGHGLSLAKSDPAYYADVIAADLVHADGGFLVTLSSLLGLPKIPERSATTDMLHDFASTFARSGHSFYLLGGEERVNRSCSAILQEKYTGLRIAGRRHGYFGDDQEEQIVEEINAVDPDVLWVGLGKPREQAFCVRWRNKLSARWIITCGGCFNYVTGDYSRAPEWMQRSNVEWMHRMVTNPRKLFWRYFLTTPRALWIALRQHGSGRP